MVDCIYRQVVIDTFQRNAYDDWNQGVSTTWANAFSECANMVKDIPSADVQPVRHGHWIERESGTEDKENGFETVIVCSHCDFPATTFYSEDCESRTQIRTDFCPNCGARMDGDRNG